MKLTITSPEHYQEFQIAWVELNSPVGNFIILPGHAPMIITLSENLPITYLLRTGHQESFASPGGIAHITRKEITLLLAKKPYSIQNEQR